MLRWILGGREAQGAVERSGVLTIGEEQPKNVFTELQVLKGHFDIVRFLVPIDHFRCASAGDDGLVLVWNMKTGQRLVECRGHCQQITSITTLTSTTSESTHTWLITASSDRTLSLWDPDTGNRVQTISDLQSSVKCLLVLDQAEGLWASGGAELCVWNTEFTLRGQRHNHSDTGITALIELPKKCLAAAMDKDIVIYRITVSSDSSVSVSELRCLSDHQDNIRTLINVTDALFASGSHAGELILWDACDWTILAYEHILWEESQADGVQADAGLAAPQPSEMSIQHLTTNGNLILAAVGSGLYVYSVEKRSVVAYKKIAHDSNVLHTMLLHSGELISCSEDGSVRMWEMQDPPLPAEPANPGFFGMWSFGRANKQPAPPSRRVPDTPTVRTLELTGDLIGHSGAVQMFLSFGGAEPCLVTCSADHLLIAWKNGDAQSHLRSHALFQKLHDSGGL